MSEQIYPGDDGRVHFRDSFGDVHHFAPADAIRIGNQVKELLGGPSDLSCALRAFGRQLHEKESANA